MNLIAISEKMKIEKEAQEWFELAKDSWKRFDPEKDTHCIFTILLLNEESVVAAVTWLVTELLIADGYVCVPFRPIYVSRDCSEPGYYQDLIINKKEAVVQTPENKVPEKKFVDEMREEYKKNHNDYVDLKAREIYKKIVEAVRAAVTRVEPKALCKADKVGTFDNEETKLVLKRLVDIIAESGLVYDLEGILRGTGGTSRIIVVSGWAEEDNHPAKPAIRGQEGPGSPEGPRGPKDFPSGPEDFGGEDFPGERTKSSHSC